MHPDSGRAGPEQFTAWALRAPVARVTLSDLPFPRGAAPAQPLPGLALSTEADPGVHDSRSAAAASPAPWTRLLGGRGDGAATGSNFVRNKETLWLGL